MFINDLLGFPTDQEKLYRCYMHTSSQSIATGTNTGVSFTTTGEDPFNMNSTIFGSSKLYVKIIRSGLYRIDCGIQYVAVAGNNRSVSIILFRNNTNTTLGTQQKEGEASSDIALNASAVVDLQHGDLIYMQAFQDSGSSIALSGTRANFLIVSELK